MESIVEDYWRNFEWFVTRIESIIWSIFTVKVITNRLSISIFTVIVIDIDTDP
jgi:hypothetical protein